MDVAEPGQGATRYRSNQEPGPACDGHVAADAGAATDSRLAEYLELHGRAVDGSVRSTMMPWSALQHVAN